MACNDSSPLHMPTGPLRKGLSHTIFSLSEEERPYTSTAYLPPEAVQLRLLFWGVCASYQNCPHICHQDSSLCRGGVCTSVQSVQSVPPKRHSYTLGKVLFSSKTTRDLYSLQLYKHDVKGSRLFISSTEPLFHSHVTTT